jgi:hypothetical protein
MVIVDHGREDMAFAQQVGMMTSLDGRTFVRRYTGVGTRRVTTFCLMTPVLARYVRLEVLVPGDKPWAVAEVYVQ